MIRASMCACARAHTYRLGECGHTHDVVAGSMNGARDCNGRRGELELGIGGGRDSSGRGGR